MELLKIEYSHWLLPKLTILFPGVPIFFFISGFLISKSYENSLNIISYVQNRILRIYPALIICVSISILSVWLLGYFKNTNVGISDILVWFSAQVSIIQFYNPSFMRAYGVGTLNGSLWTITVELQFYILVPILYRLFSLGKGNEKNISMIALVVFFLMLNILFNVFEVKYSKMIVYKLLGISFIPYFYMFLTGIFVQKNFDLIGKYLENQAPVIFILYCSLALLIKKANLFYIGSQINPLTFMLLVPTIFSLAYSKRELSLRLLKKNDVSYGIYIYHMPIVNAMIYLGVSRTIHSQVLALSSALLIAVVSWFFIEKPSLMLKKHPLNPLRMVNQ
jgi:peptidoglycan/LPS O-acetylase OafA/YrhL